MSAVSQVQIVIFFEIENALSFGIIDLNLFDHFIFTMTS